MPFTVLFSALGLYFLDLILQYANNEFILGSSENIIPLKGLLWNVSSVARPFTLRAKDQ